MYKKDKETIVRLLDAKIGEIQEEIDSNTKPITYSNHQERYRKTFIKKKRKELKSIKTTLKRFVKGEWVENEYYKRRN